MSEFEGYAHRWDEGFPYTEHVSTAPDAIDPEKCVGLPVTWNYDSTRVIGRVIDAHVDRTGLRVSVELDEESPDAIAVTKALRDEKSSTDFGVGAIVRRQADNPTRIEELDVVQIGTFVRNWPHTKVEHE